MQCPNNVLSVNKRPAPASLQITLSNRTSNPKTQDSSYPNEDVSRGTIFSKCPPTALSSQPSSVWVVICMKRSVLSCLSCLVCWTSDNGAAGACAVRRVHIRLRRKWEGLMAADGTSITAAGDNISDGRLDRQGGNIAQVTYRVFWYLVQKGREGISQGLDQFI